MSTRANIYVRDKGPNFEEVLLYHHSDGYPSTILPLLAKAEAHAKALPSVAQWKGARAGYASTLVLVASLHSVYGEGSLVPGAQPDTGLELHGDIEYLYLLTVSPMGWEVEVRSTATGFDGGDLKDAIKHTKVLINGSPLALVKAGWVEPRYEEEEV